MNLSNADAFKELEWKKFNVLDDGFVCLVDYMGDDSSVAQAARVSYGTGTKKVNNDRNLIRYLLRHRHTTPFEMCELKFLVRVPMDTWRQWVRHRTANINEYSTRYSEAIDSFQATPNLAWRLQSRSNNQGSAGWVPASTGTCLSKAEKAFHEAAKAVYRERLNAGVAREQARKDLPLSTYTEAYWKVDLHNLLHFLALRMDSHAQLEIRKYAEAIGNNIVKPMFPIVWEAFEDYRLNSTYITAKEFEAIKGLVKLSGFELSDKLVSDYINERFENKREQAEAKSKIMSMLGGA